MGTLAHSIARKKDKTIFCFLIRESDGAVYNFQTSSFVTGLHLHLVTSNLERAKYRVPYREVYTGMYKVEVDCSAFSDGDYSLDSRFLDEGTIESLTTDSVSIKILDGEAQDGTLFIEANIKAGLTLFAYIRDTFTGMYLLSDLSGFKVFSPLDDEEEVRSTFRHTFTANGDLYTLSRSLSTVPDTIIEVSVYNLRNSVEYKAGRSVTVHVLNGKQQRGVLFDEILINHDTLVNDNFRYVAPNGEPIDAAEIYVFKKSEYTSDSLDNALGRTLTNAEGRWVSPIPVQAGDTYTIVFFKGSEYGPDVAEVAV